VYQFSKVNRADVRILVRSHFMYGDFVFISKLMTSKVPGAGLSRLAYNLTVAGFTVEATDVSYIQLLATNFILSRTNDGKGRCISNTTVANMNSEAARSKFQIYPFATQFSNHENVDDQFVHYQIPDEYPADYLGEAPVLNMECDVLSFKTNRLTLSAKDFNNDFTDVSSIGAYDAVATVFFLDTAKNFMDYARKVKSLLKPGGIWINVGPLLWNCYELGPGGRREGDIDTDEDSRTRVQSATEVKNCLDVDVGKSWDPKIELSNEEVLQLLPKMGFMVRKQEILPHKAGYIQDPASMLQSKYRLSHWLVEKI
jgi:carnosine N-methyltransferase